MKKFITLSLTAAALFAATATKSFAADDVKTFSGEGKCAKCALKQTDTCQMAVVVKDGDKEKTYLVENNDVTKKFHKNICGDTAKVTVKGTLKDDPDHKGQKLIVAKEIEKAS